MDAFVSSMMNHEFESGATDASTKIVSILDPRTIGMNSEETASFGPIDPYRRVDTAVAVSPDEVPKQQCDKTELDRLNSITVTSIHGGAEHRKKSDTKESWNDMLFALLDFKARNGDMHIPDNDPKCMLLSNWVEDQRFRFRLCQEGGPEDSVLTPDRIAVLNLIGFSWNYRGESYWNHQYEALVAYKEKYGNVCVPRLFIENPKLGEWVTDQRRQLKAKILGKPSSMTDERKTKLDKLGFVWKVRERADWNVRYEQLLEFKKEKGHCIVPQLYPENRALGKWVAKQRDQYRFYRQGRHTFLTEERIDLLKSLGFSWQIKMRGTGKDAIKRKTKSTKMRDENEKKEDDVQDERKEIEQTDFQKFDSGPEANHVEYTTEVAMPQFAHGAGANDSNYQPSFPSLLIPPNDTMLGMFPPSKEDYQRSFCPDRNRYMSACFSLPYNMNRDINVPSLQEIFRMRYGNYQQGASSIDALAAYASQNLLKEA